MAAAGETTAPLTIELTVDVGDALLQFVPGDRAEEAVQHGREGEPTRVDSSTAYA